jgi:hypothetical protein
LRPRRFTEVLSVKEIQVHGEGHAKISKENHPPHQHGEAGEGGTQVLIVEVRINDTVIGRATARRVRPVGRKIGRQEVCTYKIDEGMLSERMDTHRYGDGAKVLAKLLLEGMEVR